MQVRGTPKARQLLPWTGPDKQELVAPLSFFTETSYSPVTCVTGGNIVPVPPRDHAHAPTKRREGQGYIPLK
jgi:hypothetical protein